MADILSQEEIDALLKVVDDEEASESIGDGGKKEQLWILTIFKLVFNIASNPFTLATFAW